MIRENISGLLLAGALAVTPISNVLAHPLGTALATEPNLITVQGWPGSAGGYYQQHREYCWGLRNRAQELRQQIYYASPWDKDRMERHLWRVRERMRAECWGGGW